jgi:hypothetical protein
MTRDRKSVKPFTCRFVSINVEINDTRYAVDPIEPGECGTKAFRLAKHSGDHAVYDVIRTHTGLVECDCPDYETRHRGNGYGMCKHGRALVELGLMAAPIAPAPCCPASEPAPCVTCQASTAAAGAPEATSEPAIAEAIPAEAPIESNAPADDQVELGAVESDPSTWPEWTDADTWELSPEPSADEDLYEPTAEDRAEAAELFGAMDAQRHLDRSDRLTLPELVDLQADFYRGWKNPVGEMLARHMEELAMRIRWVKAETPADYDARHEIVEQDARETHYKAGFEAGRASMHVDVCA